MNRIFRLVWNRSLNVWMAVAESAKGRGKGSTSRPLVAAALALTGVAFFLPLAQAGPVGGQVSAGSGTISQAGLATTIQQGSQNLAIDWQSFGIAANESVRFIQPNASAIALNRVLGQDPSQILGSLSANGQVFVLNPNGVLFGAGAQVDVGGLVASTLSMSNADFMAGKHVFTHDGNSTSSVVNQGTLTAAQGGYIALLAPEVRNEGVISATLGTALLAAGDQVRLTLDNGSLLGYSIEQGALRALAENRQLIQADGGQVILSAMALDALSSASVNNSGLIEAKTLNHVAGRIVLSGDMGAGQALQLGTLDVSAPSGGDAGSVRIAAAAVLDAGQIHASSASGKGGQMEMTATGSLIQTAQAAADANGASGGGSIALMGNNVFSSASLQALGTGPGARGGSIDVLAHNQVALAAAQLDAGASAGAGGQGGTLRVGGDFQGANAQVVNAGTTIVNGATTLRANGGSAADGGQVIVWSEELTQYHGQIEAQGGEVEVSSRNALQFSGDVIARTLLLDPKNITISAASGPAAYALIDPNAGAGRSFGSNATVLGTTTGGIFTPGERMVINVNSDNGNRGASYLYDTTSGALVSTLVGSTANDYVGSGDVTVLNNGSYVVTSTDWNNGGTAAAAGAVTWGSGTTGVSGAVSSLNSLVGSADGDRVGSGGVTALSNGNYVVRSDGWNNGGALANAGAATWGSGTAGVAGAVSSSNSLVGSTASDRVGGDGIMALSNGNYVVRSTNWDNGLVVNAGAATWGNGLTGVSGAISSLNSLVGSTAGDRVSGNGLTALSNGNYVVASGSWNNGGVTSSAGAATWGNGLTGVSGAISSLNSLVGSTAGDRVGSGGVTALSNGSYVVRSDSWNNGGALANAGAATWGSGTAGVAGAVSSLNSLVGSTADDQVSSNGITVLNNGNYVVGSVNWDRGGVVNAGAATWGNGTTGISGAISNLNSLVGSTANDLVGGGITALSNGNYVVGTGNWNNGGSAANAGAATWGSGSTGASGAVSSLNSLVGSTANDYVGSSITALSNGSYVVGSYSWDNGSVGNAGAATWGSGTAGVSGAVSSLNSLVGSTANDYVGSAVTALSNGNYVVRSGNWNNGGTVANAGAATWGNGSTGVVGAVSSLNSLVGSTANDYVGNSDITALSNGNYVVGTGSWNNGGAIANAGAATWGNGSTGVVGAVSSLNSLVGSTANDYVGNSGITALSNGNYVVGADNWNSGGTAAAAGAVTWGSGTSGVVGAVSSSNSLVGSTANDRVGGTITALGNGNYAVRSASFNGNTGQVLVGSPGDLSFATAAGQSMNFNPDNIKSLLAAGTAVTLQASNDITVASAINVAGSTGGALTLQAGRSILFNANVSTANGNLTAVANDAAAIAGQRDAGSGDIVIAAGVTLDVGTGTANLAGQRFVNNSGAGAVSSTGAGRWLVWSDDPAGDSAGGLSPGFRQYAASYGGAVAQPGGNGFLYRSLGPATVSPPSSTPVSPPSLTPVTVPSAMPVALLPAYGGALQTVAAMGVASGWPGDVSDAAAASAGAAALEAAAAEAEEAEEE